jgi:hypothetical protein
LCLFPGRLGPWSSYLHFLNSRDDGHMPPHLALGWDGSPMNFLPGVPLNLDPSDVHLLSRWDYRDEPLHPSSLFLWAILISV